MEVKDIAEYEEKDSRLARSTIAELHQEIDRLNNIINELNNAYCKVITKCEEMIDSRFYMNDIAIKKYADEIKDICKYYVGEAKEFIIKENK